MGEKLPAKSANNWDLQAVVSCFSTKNYAPAAAAAGDEKSSDPLAFLANMEFDKEEDDPFSFPLLLENKNKNGFDELQDSYRPFFSTPSSVLEQQLNNSSTVSHMNSSFHPPFVFGEQNNQRTQQTHHVQQVLQQQQPLIQQQRQKQQQQPEFMMPSQAPRSRKRKASIKKMVCQVKFEHLSADTWSWRKYGQKPIKGSPYPRNYYRCSSSKGCGARKQVERSNTDPGIYIVSYTGDHTHPRPTHRNSLAGSTRNKFSTTHQSPVPPAIAISSSSSHLPATCHLPRRSPPAPSVEEMNDTDHRENNKGFMEEEEDDGDDDLFEDLLIPNIAAPAIDEDFFKGLNQLGTTAASGSGGNDG